MDENLESSEAEKVVVEFPKTYYCQRCRRDYTIRSCHTRWNTLLTEIALTCPRCKKRFSIMRLKDWYDNYIHERV